MKGRSSWLAVLLVGGLGLRLANAWSPLEARPFSGVPDDTFYYFAIARHIAQGHVPSLDGLNATNGYQPLWMLVLVALMRLGGWEHGSRAPLHAAFTLGAVLDLLSALLLHRILRRLGVRSDARLLALAVFLLNPYAVELATWGLETPLALLLCLCFLYVAAFGERPGAPAWMRSPITFGAVGALMMLARTDHAVPFFVVWLWRGLSHPVAARLRWLLAVAASATLGILPWLAYSWATCGTVVQSSSLAIAITFHRMPAAWGIEAPGLGLHGWRLMGSVLDAAFAVVRFSGYAPLACAVIAAAGVALVAPPRRRLLPPRLRAILPWATGLAVLFVLHVAVRMVFREWYTAPLCATVLLGMAVFADAAGRAMRRGPLRAAFVASLALTLGAGLVFARTSGSVYGRADFRDWVWGSPGQRVAFTDCGASAYFRRSTVTNLDGVVNRAALQALERGNLTDYIASSPFEHFGITPQLHSRVFMGDRYRERMTSASTAEPVLLRMATAQEKDARIELGAEPLTLGSLEGRELLSDGWDWPATPTDFIPSVGFWSEIVFRTSGANLELELASGVAGVRVQPVEVTLDGQRVATWNVGGRFAWYSVSLRAPARSRHRLRLAYPEARVVRARPGPHPWDGWNWIYGSPLRAVQIRGIRALPCPVALPPDGPSLGAAGSERVLAEGWLDVERPGGAEAAVWSIAGSATIIFGTSYPSKGRRLELQLGPPPPDGEHGGQRVDVLLNGVELGRIELPPGVVSAHELQIPDGLLRACANELRLSFERISEPDAHGVRRSVYLRRVGVE